MKKVEVTVYFTEELLGTASANPNLHSEFIASKAPDAASREEEVAAIGVSEVIEKGMTIFPKDDDGDPFVWDYQWKGFFKDACGSLYKVPGMKSYHKSAYKKEIDGTVFVSPRKIPLDLPSGGTLGNCQRPLRAYAGNHEVTALANSETAPAGTMMKFEVMLLQDSMLPLLIEWLDYGILRGLGQWRNSGKGRFEYHAVTDDGKEFGNPDLG